MPKNPKPYEEPLDGATCRALVRRSLSAGTVELDYWAHCLERMGERNMCEDDCLNVLYGGFVDESKTTLKDDLWRYRFCTSRMWVVVALPDILWKKQGELPDMIYMITCHREDT